MSKHKESPIGRTDIERFLRAPIRPDIGLRTRIQRFLETQTHYPYDGSFSKWDESGVWQFLFDANDLNVPPDPTGTPLAARRAHWLWLVILSDRGPLVTCQSFSVALDPLSESRGNSFRIDDSARPTAVDWTQQIAREFGLHYVDAKMLRDWQVSYEDVDPEFDLEHDVLAVPNAFQVLFYE